MIAKQQQRQNHIHYVKIAISRGDYARLASPSTKEISGAANTIRSGATTSSTTKLRRYGGINYINGDNYGYRSSDREVYDCIFGLLSIVFDSANGAYSEVATANYWSTTSEGDARAIIRINYN